MKTNVYSADGKKSGEVELPEAFSEAYRPDIIKRAFYADMSTLYQPKGADPESGLKGVAESWGTCGARARIPRKKAGPRRGGRKAKGSKYRSKGRWFPAAGKAAQVPIAVGGREAHPPKSIEVIFEKINKKEYEKAIMSAIAATSNAELVKARGHKIGQLPLPLVVEDSFCSFKKTKEFVNALNLLGLSEEIARTCSRKIRAGKGKLRARKYHEKIGPLVVLPEKKGTAGFCAKNIPGMDVLSIEELKVMNIAPGANAGRLVIWTKTSLKKLEERFKHGAL